MQFTRLQFIAVAVVSVLFASCSGSKDGGSVARVDQRDGSAVCVFSQGDNVYKFGKVDNDQVELYATYGRFTLALKDVEEAISNISPKDVEDAKDQQRALYNALFSLQLPGIWKVEKVSIDGKGQAVRDDDPNYLVIRADKTYRIIRGTKAGRNLDDGPEG